MDAKKQDYPACGRGGVIAQSERLVGSDRRRGIDRTWRPDRSVDRWLSKAPYGMWTCGDGREVLFNRFYVPMAERVGPASPARRSDAYEWVRWKRQEHYFHDGSFRSPALRAETLLRLNAILAAWGLPGLREPPR
jgi:hypothetical protein